MEEVRLRRLLECPVCLDVKLNCNYYNCKQGHKVCQNCFRNLETMPKECPTCRGKYDHPMPRRNLDVEQMITECDLDFPCPNSKSGCLLMLKRQELDSHAAECLHRTVICPLSTCKKSILVSNMAEHTKAEHNSYIMKNRFVNNVLDSCLVYAYKANLNGVTVLFLDDKLFFHFMKKSQEGLWYTWVSMAAGAKEARKWKVELTIYNDEKSISTSMNAFSIPIDAMTTLNKGNVWEQYPSDCLEMSDQKLKCFLNPSIEEATEKAKMYVKFVIKKENERSKRKL